MTEFHEEKDLPEERQAELAFDALSKVEETKPKKLLILDEREVTLRHSGVKVRLYKTFDTETGESRRIALDAENRPIDYEKLMQTERTIWFEKYGCLQPELQRRAELGHERKIPVVIKFAVKEELLDKSTMEEDAAFAEAEPYARQLQVQVEREAEALFREALAEYALELPDEPSRSGPFISTELPAHVIRSLYKHPRIAFMGLDQEPEVLDYPTIADSLPTTRTNFVHSAGTRGSGIKIAVLESGTLTVAEDCFNIGDIRTTSGSGSSHMTKSVGIIGNRYNGGSCEGAWEGYAPEATVLIANGSDYKDRYEWAKSKGVNVITMSWHFTDEEDSGSLHARDIYFDYAVTHYPYPTVFTSAGNQASSSAYASGKGYNFFGVGNVENDGDGNRCNDTISSSSSCENPTSPHSDREIPEVAAPGSRHELLGSSFGGTSCATPVTASIATLLMSRNTRLKIWPEAIRAILLATANFQGADGAEWSKYADGADGTGLINAQYAHWTAGRRETGTQAQYRAHDYGTMRASDFEDRIFEKTWTARTSTTRSRIRVAFTWNSKTATSDGSPTSSVLDADLDLWVYDPDGHLVAWSTTWDSNYEFVEFTPSKIGEYTIKIRGYSVPSDFWSWYGIAWTTHYDLCT